MKSWVSAVAPESSMSFPLAAGGPVMMKLLVVVAAQGRRSVRA
jgi:hypothetical protein